MKSLEGKFRINVLGEPSKKPAYFTTFSKKVGGPKTKTKFWKKLNLDSIVVGVRGGSQCRHPLSCLICESSAHLLAITSIHL